MAKFEGDDFRIRLLRDRAQLFVEVGPPDNSDDWYDLRLVLEFLGQPTVDGERSPDEEALKDLQAGLVANYQGVLSLFEKTNYRLTKSRLEEFRRAKVRERFEKYLN